MDLEKLTRSWRIPTAAGLVFLLTVEHVPFAHAQAAAAAGQARSAAAAPTAPPPPAASVQDAGWPRQLVRDGATLVYYQPQLDEWKDYRQLRARLAFTIAPSGGKEVAGVASLTANTLVDSETRTAFLRDITVASVRFPSSDPETARQMELLFRTLMPSGGEPIAVDRILAMMQRDQLTARTVALKNDPPAVFYSETPALLLLVDGEPVLAPIEKTELEFVVNTNWDVFRDKSKKTYFLLAPNGWLTASELKGPWTATQTLPKDMSKLPAGESFEDVKKALPARASGPAPQVFYSDAPAELIQLRGAPIYSKIPGTELLYVTNTDGDALFDNRSRQFYVLFSGRWFRGAALTGPWAPASDSLPPDFLKIPAGSPKVGVRVAVPGTQEAADAVMLAQIPTTAVINKADAEAQAKVSYDGPPQFAPVPQTSLTYATNTDAKVIKVGDLYYLCFQGVWFMSTSANGPWKTADTVPPAIYSIGPSAPVYNVTYVTQTSPTPTTVESSYTAGYFGMFVVGMSVGLWLAYGTGYRYPPYIYRPPGMGYPIYRPWPRTYGVAAVYNPRTGAYGVGRAAYGTYGAASGAAWYNPSTGRYGRSASVQGYGGGRTAASAYNPWTGGYARTQQGHNAYSQWGSSVATRGNQWVQTGHVTTAGGTTAGYRTSSGQSGVIRSNDRGTVARTDSGVYAGKDGNVYKRDSKGDWSKYDNGSWNQVDRASAKAQGVESSAQERDRGQRESQRHQATTQPRQPAKQPRQTERAASSERRPERAAGTSTPRSEGGGRRGGRR